MKGFVCIFLMLLVAFQANAGHICAGKVDTLDIGPTGSVAAGIGNMGQGNVVCSLNTSHGRYTAESCKAIYSLLLSAKLANKDVRLWFANDTDTSCTKGSWIDFANHDLYHIRIEG